jgi:hypothetical protein
MASRQPLPRKFSGQSTTPGYRITSEYNNKTTTGVHIRKILYSIMFDDLEHAL